jgi:isopropylmalate/homocitrate/citramalate synthase
MMLLGKVIKLAMTAQSQFPEDVLLREPGFAAELEQEAQRAGMDVPLFVADTVGRFMAREDGESWTTIVGNIQRTDDPGYTFLSTIMHARVRHRCVPHW